MSNIPCSVIQDLLPLYVDDACSEQSKEIVEAHLQACAACSEQLAAMKEELGLPTRYEVEQQDTEVIQSLAKAWHKTKLFAWIKGIVVASISFAALIAIYMLLTEWKIIAVPAQNFEVSDVYQLSDGSISYWLKATDGYELNLIKKTYDDQGNAYVQGYRPLIKRKTELKYGLHNYLYRIDLNMIQRLHLNDVDWNNEHSDAAIQFDLTNNSDQLQSIATSELKAVYYGTAENSILIWEQGMELPQASAELERYWLDDQQTEKQIPGEQVN